MKFLINILAFNVLSYRGKQAISADQIKTSRHNQQGRYAYVFNEAEKKTANESINPDDMYDFSLEFDIETEVNQIKKTNMEMYSVLFLQSSAILSAAVNTAKVKLLFL